MSSETSCTNKGIQNSKIAEIISDWYRKKRLKIEQRAKKEIDKCVPNKQEDLIRNYIRRYKILNAVANVVGPTLLTCVVAIWRRPNPSEMYGKLNALVIFVPSIIILAIVVIAVTLLTFFKKDVWDCLLDKRKEDERSKLVQKMEALTKDYDAALNNNAVLSESLSLIACLDDNPNRNAMETLVTRIHGQLGSGEYSVGVYIANKNKYTLAEYTESRLSADSKPSSYQNVLKEAGSKHKKYRFFKCLYDSEPGPHQFLEKKDINKDNFDGDFSAINQYVSYSFQKDKEYNLLLEIIAYNQTTFNKLLSTNENFFTNLFLAYIPVFRKYASEQVIKENYKIVS